MASISKSSQPVTYQDAFEWITNLYNRNKQTIQDLTGCIGKENGRLMTLSDGLRDKSIDSINNKPYVEFYKSAVKTFLLAKYLLEQTQQVSEFCTYPAWTEHQIVQYVGQGRKREDLEQENANAQNRLTELQKIISSLNTQIHAIEKGLNTFSDTLDKSLMREQTGNSIFARGLRSLISNVSFLYLNKELGNFSEGAELEVITKSNPSILSQDIQETSSTASDSSASLPEMNPVEQASSSDSLPEQPAAATGQASTSARVEELGSQQLAASTAQVSLTGLSDSAASASTREEPIEQKMADPSPTLPARSIATQTAGQNGGSKIRGTYAQSANGISGQGPAKKPAAPVTAAPVVVSRGN